MDIYIGQAGFRGDFAGYSRRHSFLELLAEPQRLPALKKLKQWRQQAPPGFKFAVVVPPAALDATLPNALEFALKVVSALSPEIIVLRTPTAFRPTQAAATRLATFVSLFDGAAPTIGWEPRGMWQGPKAARVAQEVGVLLVQDINEVIASQTTYVRIRGVGSGRKVGGSVLHKLAPCLETTQALFISIEGTGVGRLMDDLEESGAQSDWDEEALLGELARLNDEDTSQEGEALALPSEAVPRGNTVTIRGDGSDNESVEPNE